MTQPMTAVDALTIDVGPVCGEPIIDDRDLTSHALEQRVNP